METPPVIHLLNPVLITALSRAEPDQTGFIIISFGNSVAKLHLYNPLVGFRDEGFPPLTNKQKREAPLQGQRLEEDRFIHTCL